MEANEEYIENYGENENAGGMNLGEEEYEEENMNENGEEEEGQNVYAFDIQINDDSYLLVTGKTDENKLLFRLIDKEDENKPFFQNDFSLEDLRNLNPFFNNIDDENIAFQYIISNLNDADKEIKIIDDEKIKLSISINDEDLKINISFVLFKTMNDFEGEEENPNELLISNNNEANEHMNEGEGEKEEVELMDHLIKGYGGEDQVEEGEIDLKNLRSKEEEIINKSGKGNALSSNLPLQIDQQNINSKLIEKKEILKKSENGVETVVEKKEITRISNKNQDAPVEQKEIKIITESKIEPGQKNEVKQSIKESIKKEPQQMEQIDNRVQNNGEEIILLKEELLNTINSLSENFNNQLIKQNEIMMKMKQEMKEENERKINEMKNALNKKDNDLNDIKNKFEILNKKMMDLEKNLNENNKMINGYDIKINEINNKVDNIDKKVKNINNIVTEAIENNNKKIKSDIDEISKQLNEKLKLRKSVEKEPVKEETKNLPNTNNYDDIINELSNNMQAIESQVGELQNALESYQNNNDNNIKIIDDKINDLEEKLEQNNIALVNLENENKNKMPNQNDEQNINIINNRLNDIDNAISEFGSKLNNLENNLNNLRNSTTKKDIQDKNPEIVSKLGNFENTINNFDTKLKNLENNMKNMNQKPQKNNEDLEIYGQRINELENYAKNIEARINDYEIDNIIQNLSILMEKQNDTELYDKINNIEAEINELRENANKPNVELRKSTDKKDNAELINKINNIENIINIYENRFKKIEDEKLNNNNYKNNNDKRADKLEKRIANVSKQSDDLEIKIDQLFNITKDLENSTKNLDKKTNDIMNNVTKISKEANAEKLRNAKSERANNYAYMDNNQTPPYNKTNINKNIAQANIVYQPVNKTRQKPNYEIENQYNNTNPNIRNTGKNNAYAEANYSYSGLKEDNHIESRIVKDNEIQFLINRLREMHPRINNISFNLVYRATEDGDKAADFHKKCDRIGPNITLIKTKKGYIFGGFTFKNWEHMPRDIDVNKPNLGSASRDSRAFGFSVSNQKVYNNDKPNEFAIWCNKNFGPTFKNNLFQIFDSCLRKGGYCSIRSNSHFGGQLYDYEISGGESRFRVEELEVYEIKLH